MTTLFRYKYWTLVHDIFSYTENSVKTDLTHRRFPRYKEIDEQFSALLNLLAGKTVVPWLRRFAMNSYVHVRVCSCGGSGTEADRYCDRDDGSAVNAFEIKGLLHQMIFAPQAWWCAMLGTPVVITKGPEWHESYINAIYLNKNKYTCRTSS